MACRSSWMYTACNDESWIKPLQYQPRPRPTPCWCQRGDDVHVVSCERPRQCRLAPPSSINTKSCTANVDLSCPCQRRLPVLLFFLF